MRTCLVWECTCGLMRFRRVDTYDPREPDPERCPECGEPWKPQRTVVTTVADREVDE